MKTTILATLAFLGTVAASMATEAKASNKKAPSWTTTPCRYLGKSETDYIQAMKARFAIHGRNVGPFGRNQDPTEEKIDMAIKARPGRALSKKSKTPFDEVIGAIKVTTVNFRKKTFYADGQRYRVGEQFPLELGDEKFLVRIDTVGSKAIGFTDMKTGEYIAKPFNQILGVKVGSGPLSVPGVTRPGTSRAPMKLELGNTPKRSR